MRRNREQWSALADEQDACGQSVATFCHRRGLEARTYQWWRWKLGRGRQGSRRTPVRLVPVDVVERAGTADASATGDIAIELGSMTVRIVAGTSPEYVAKLVAALRERC